MNKLAKLFCVMFFSAAILIQPTMAESSCSSYDRGKAVKYAQDNWNKRNPAYNTTYGNDCTNFVSQALVAGGLGGFNPTMCTGPGVPCFDFAHPTAACGGCVDDRGMIIRVNPLPGVLGTYKCANVSGSLPRGSTPTNLKVGDVVVVGKNGFSQRSHATIVVETDGTFANTKVAMHTDDHPGKSLQEIHEGGYYYFTYAHFPHDDNDNKCSCFEQDPETSQCKKKEKCNEKCETCDPNTGACQPKNQQWIPMGRCSQLAQCNPDTGEPQTNPGGPMVCADDTLTVGTGIAWKPLPSTDQGSAVGVLKMGFTHNVVNLLQSFKENPRVVNPDELSPNLAKEMPLLIIPSAGLYGMEKSGLFKATLEAYVNEGGTILVMGQQYGYAYAALPGQVDGYGWLEDQMCFANSSYITTWHPVLAGQTRSTPSIGVDGYFTKYPDNTTVILRRTANGQPDLILYPFGRGHVIASSFYTDSAFSSGSASAEEKSLIRDIVAWAKAPTTLPEIKLGETINLNIPIKNTSKTLINATQARITIYDPDKKNVVYQTSMPINLAPGAEAALSVAYTAAPNSATGIYQVLYDLTGEGLWYYDDEDPSKYQIVTWLLKDLSGDPSGRFAVTNPPKTGYQLSGITYAIQSDSFAYINNSPAAFTIKIWNNSDLQRTITARYDDQSRNVTVAPKGLETITYSKNISWGKTGLTATFYDEANKYLGSTFRNGVLMSPATKVAASLNKAYYAKGETVSINTTIQNKTLSEIRTSWQADVKTIIYDSNYSIVFEDTKTVTVQPSQTVTETTNYVVPATARLGTYTIYVQVLHGNSHTGSAYTRFDLPQSRISVAPNLAPFISDSKTISFSLSNTGAIKVSSGTLDVNLKDPEGVTVYEGTLLFGLLLGETKTMTLPVSAQALNFGNYVLTYTQSDETHIGMPVTNKVPNTAEINSNSAKPIYKIGETANISITVKNTGKFIQEGALTITVPVLGLTETRTIVVDPTVSASVPYSIPLPVTLNSGIEVNVSFALSGGQTQRSVPINILPVSIDQTIQFDKPSYRIRETLGMNYVLTNDGSFASPLNATLSLSIPDTGYTHDSSFMLEPDKATALPLNVLIPETLSAGQHIITATLTLPSGRQVVKYFHFVIPEVKFAIMPENRNAYAAGETVNFSIANSGGVDGHFIDYEVFLFAGTGERVYNKLLSDAVPAGQSRSYNIVMPDQALSGVYRLIIGDGSDVTVMKEYVITGVSAKLNAKTDKPVYFKTEAVTASATVSNGAVALTGAELKMRIVQKGNNSTVLKSIPKEWLYLSKEDMDASKRCDDCTIEGNLPFPFSMQGTTFTRYSVNSNGAVELLPQSGSFQMNAAAGNPENMIAAYPDATMIFASFDDLVSTWNGFFGVRHLKPGDRIGEGQPITEEALVFHWETETYSNEDYGYMNNFEVLLYPDGRVQWNFDTMDYDAYDYQMYSGIYDGRSGMYLEAGRELENASYLLTTSPFVPTIHQTSKEWFPISQEELDAAEVCDDCYFAGTLPFPFRLQGNVFTRYTTNSNGGIELLPDTGNFRLRDDYGYPGDVIASYPGATMIFASLDDLVPAEGGYFGVKHVKAGDTDANGNIIPDEAFVFYWKAFTYYDDTPTFNYFEVLLYPNGRIRWNIDAMNYQGSDYDMYSGIYDGGSGLHMPVGKGLANASYLFALLARGERVLFEKTIYADQPAGATQSYDADAGMLNATGKLYLEAELRNSLGQMVATAQYPFSIVEGNTVLLYGTDKRIYRSGETVMITGEVRNLASIDAVALSLDMKWKTGDGADETLYAETFDVQAGGSHAFMVTGVAGTEGSVTLTGTVSQNNSESTKTIDTFEVEYPAVTAAITAPRVAGTGQFTISVEIKNTGRVDVTMQYAAGGSQGTLNDHRQVTIPAGETKLLQYSQQITADTMYTFTFAGDLIRTFERTVYFGERAEIQATVQPLYKEGDAIVPYTVTNTGLLEANYPVTVTLLKDGQQLAKNEVSFLLPPGAGSADSLRYALGEGHYVLNFATTGFEAESPLIVVKSGQAALTLNPDAMYREGTIGVSHAIANTGMFDEIMNVRFQMSNQQGATVELLKTYFAPKNGGISDVVFFDLAAGDYQLLATIQSPSVSAAAPIAVRKENQADMNLTMGTQSNGLFPVNIIITNHGFNSVEGTVRLSVTNIQGNETWSGEQAVSQITSSSSQHVEFNINPATFAPGAYTVTVELLNSSGQQMAAQNLPFTLLGAAIQIIQLPPYQTFTPGQNADMTFKVLNTGNQEGTAEIRLKAYDLIDSTQSQWLMPGEEKEITFNFQMPIDLEENDYFADYEFKSTGGQLQKGQVKYHLAGINIQVNAALDKQNYAVGETARLAITVSQQDAMTMDLYANVVYGQYENRLPFALNGSQTLTFDIPLDEISGQKLYYGIYTESGRSLHLNSLYIYRSGAGLVITTDKQVYEPSERVSITINSTSEATGTMTLTSQNYSETFAFSGSASKSLTLPANMGAGTYFINAELRTSAPELITGSHPIDINGIQLRVTDAKLDKGKYNPADTLLVTAKIQSNTTFAGSLRMSIIDPDNVVLPLGQYGISITSPDEIPYSGEYPLATSKAGMHKLMYSVYSGDMLLASGPLAFDVGDAVLLGISPDKKDYPSASEPVTAVVSMYGTGNANLEILVDDAIVRTEPVTLNGVATLSLELPSMTPGTHALKAILKAGGLTSTKSSSFKYGSSLPDLAPTITPSAEIGPDATMQFTVSVTNHGSDASSATTLSVFDGDNLIDSKSVRALNAADVDTISVAWNILGKTGDHIIKAVVDPQNTVIEFDENNNTAVVNITIPADTTPPLTVITVGSPKYDANGDIFSSSGTVFSLIATDDLSGVAMTEYRLDVGAWTSYNTPFSIVSEGTHTIDYRSQDIALNMETAKSLVVHIDTTPPTGNMVINGGAEYANSTTVTLTLLCDDMRSGCARMSFSNDNTSWSAPEAYTTAKTWSLVPEDGTKAAYVKYIDGVGNPSAAYNASILLDTMSPTTTATPLGGLYDSARTVNLFANEPAVIYYTTNGSIPTTSATVYAGPIAIQDNTTLLFFAKDRAGNAEVVTRQTYTIDTQPPTLDISTLPDGSYTNNGTLNIAGIVKDDIEVQGVTINDTATPVNADGTFNQALSLATGSNTITIIAKDTAGHAAMNVRTIVFDQTTPTLIITNPSDNIVTNIADLTVTGAVDETSTVSVKVNSGNAAPAAMDGTTFSLPVTLEAGMNTIEVTATDLAANSGKDKRTVTYDNVNPSLAVNSPGQDITTDQSSILLQGTVSDLTAIAVTIHHDGRTFTPAITAGLFQQLLSFDTEKTYAITVTASDAAGNTTIVQRNVIYQKTPFPMAKTTLAYTGATLIAQGGELTLSGVLKVNSTEASIPDGKTVTFTIGNGSNSQSCTGTTDSKGKAHCRISSISIPTGPATITAVFSGDAYYQPSFSSKNVIIFAYTTSGSFVIGDRNAVVNNSVTFWGAKWRKDNVLSGGSAPASFKGYAEVTSSTPPTCDGTWVSKPGSSSKPPASLPSYIAVLAADSITKVGSSIKGDNPEIVIVRVNQDYDMGRSGTGTVVGKLCQRSNRCDHEGDDDSRMRSDDEHREHHDSDSQNGNKCSNDEDKRHHEEKERDR